jgi:nitroreductase
MTTPTFDDLARAQRLCGSFTDDPVPDEMVEWMLDLASRAPRLGDHGPWVFVVVRDLAVRAELSVSAPDVAGAPVQVVVGVDTALVARGRAAAAFPAIQNLLLAAGAAGYGAALTTAPLPNEVALAVGFPPTVHAIAVVGLGRAGELLRPAARQPFEASTHRDRYGSAWDSGASTRMLRPYQGPTGARRLTA